MSKTNVLIVEDEAIIAADLEAKLALLGYRVVGVAASGEDAVEMAGRLFPDVVLMDIRLQGSMDGIEAADAIRRSVDLPVIYLTAHSDAATLARAKISEPSGYLLKPFEEREVAIAMELALYKHQAERRLRDTNEKLAAANEDLAAANEELRAQAEELLAARKAADAATRAKGLFLANMSHELRTPMTGVIGMLDVVLSGQLDSAQRDCLVTARGAAGSMVRILNDILDMTKIEAGVLSLVDEPFSLRKSLKETFDILLPAARGKQLEFELRVPEDVPDRVRGDRTRIVQVLSNLAGNAVKFTEKGRIEICVGSGAPGAEGRPVFTFTVTDTGIGISDSKKPRLFHKFSQADDSHSRGYGGAGLGLAISREIVERMGGVIGFESVEGRGSRFSFSVPLAVETGPFADSREDGRTRLPVERLPPEGKASPKLLLVEDDEVIRKTLVMMLSRCNYRIECAANGREAVEAWKSGRHDLILMDVQMPVLDGFDATSAIRAIEETHGGRVPIIAMTAHALKEDEERCLAAGMDDYISKPIDFTKTLRKIAEALDKR